jgi:MFS family permease
MLINGSIEDIAKIRCKEGFAYPFGLERKPTDFLSKIMPQFKKTFGLPADAKKTADIVSNVVSTLQAGCFLGALIAFYIADKWGRRVGHLPEAIFFPLFALHANLFLAISYERILDGHLWHRDSDLILW